MASIFERVRKVTVAQMGINEEVVTPSCSLADDLGADSLDQVEIVMALEDEFSTADRKINIPDDDAEKLTTVQDIIDYLRNLGISDRDVPKPVEKPGLHLNLPQPGTHKAFSTPGAAQPAANQNRRNRPGNQPRWNNQRRRDGPRPSGPSNQPQPHGKPQPGQQGNPSRNNLPPGAAPGTPPKNQSKDTRGTP